jgi:glycine/D-amino acid oxidase-like deaminating enzyme
MHAGARLQTSSPVVSARRTKERWRVKTPAGAVTADWLIVATDVYSHGPWRQVRAEQVRLPYFNVATAPLSAELRRSILPHGQGVWDTRQILSSFRMDQSGRLIFGSVGALRGFGIGIHRAWAKRELAKLFPQLGRVPIEAEWYGQIGMTDDSVPRFHRFGPNAVGFSGYNGRGIAPGTIFGRVLADLVDGKLAESDLPLAVTPLNTPCFVGVKEAFYEAGAQLAHVIGARAARLQTK